MTKTRKRRLAHYAVLACAMGSIMCSIPAADEGVPWLSNYREALRLAKESRKPLFVEFRCEA